MGQPTKLTDEVSKRIVSAIRRGNTAENASALAGIAYSTYRQWLQRGRGEHPDRGPSEVYVAFVAAVKKAKAHAESRAVSQVRDAAMQGTWQAACWWLERRRHKQWGRKDLQRIDAKVESGPPVSAREYLARIEAALPELRRRAAEEATKGPE